MDAPRHARVLVIGHSCLDSISVTEEHAPADGKLEADRIWTGPGGPGANAAIALRRLGHEVALATSLASDAAGRLVESGLRAEGIELLIPLVDEGTSSLAQIRATGAERSVVWRRGKLPLLEADRALVSAWMGGIDLLYVDGHEVPTATAALEFAREQGIRSVADPGSLRPGAEDWPKLLDSFVATPRWIGSRYPDASSLGDAVSLLASDARDGAVVGVTLGARGGIAEEAGERLTWRARKTGAVDTTVAGDAFHAGLADALVQGMSLRDGLDWAATLAASVCRAPGHSALPKNRGDLALWHGRWGHRPEMGPDFAEQPAAAILS